MRDGRYCLPVKAEYKNQVPGMVHDQSSTGSTLFIEPMAIMQLNNELRELEIQEQKEIEAVLADLSNAAGPLSWRSWRSNLQILTKLDFHLRQGGPVADTTTAAAPMFNDNGYIQHQGRPPSRCWIRKSVVPINIYLGKDFDLLIVTGPNTGGKTVSLKTVGLFTLMGQAGLHIPAFDGSELAVFRRGFRRHRRRAEHRAEPEYLLRPHDQYRLDSETGGLPFPRASSTSWAPARTPRRARPWPSPSCPSCTT